jgi:hypothetical protein
MSRKALRKKIAIDLLLADQPLQFGDPGLCQRQRIAANLALHRQSTRLATPLAVEARHTVLAIGLGQS